VISLSSGDAARSAIERAATVTFAAYGLWPGRMKDALLDAARCGARVTVRLNGHFNKPAYGMPQDNREAVRELRSANADARLVCLGKRYAAFHLKALVCDGVAYLDDSNWRNSGDTIVRDDNPRDVRAIRAAASGRRIPSASNVQLDKTCALRAERALLLARGTRSADVETESIGTGGVYGALKTLAARHIAVRVLISSQEKNDRPAVLLKKAGADVRVTRDTEKFAVVNGTRAWIGSANATWSPVAQPDWSTDIYGKAAVKELERRFEERWRTARPLRIDE
jgi:phosphatidylserine/phosphatidylglycerophosphate/cardiolipin synthase-like enzyme